MPACSVVHAGDCCTRLLSFCLGGRERGVASEASRVKDAPTNHPPARHGGLILITMREVFRVQGMMCK